MLLIPGTSSVAHLEENVAAIDIELDEADVALLDGLGRRPGGAGG
jgi:aryl-alcohol dehydrogenase-like predicted oxidoreductase